MGQIGPVAAFLVELVGGIEIDGIASGVDRLDPAIASFHRAAGRSRARRPIWQRKNDRLFMAETMVLYEFLSSFVESFRLTRCHRPGYDTLSLTTGDELMASIRKRTWITAKGERSAWVVSYAHNGR